MALVHTVILSPQALSFHFHIPEPLIKIIKHIKPLEPVTLLPYFMPLLFYLYNYMRSTHPVIQA